MTPACIVEARHVRMAGLYCDRSRPGWRGHEAGAAYRDAVAAVFSGHGAAAVGRVGRMTVVERWADGLGLPRLH